MYITKKKKIAIVCMVVWLLIIFLFSMEVAADHPSFGFEYFFVNILNTFIPLGILPVVIIWGAIWIWITPSEKKNKEIE